MTDMPELHTRLLADVIALGSPYPLVLTGGYAVRAHRLVNRAPARLWHGRRRSSGKRLPDRPPADTPSR